MSESKSVTASADVQDFIFNFEYDILRVLDEIIPESDSFKRSKIIKKGSMFLKGDYFVSLQDGFRFCGLEEKLIEKLREFAYIRNCEVDCLDNLIICLNKPIIYQHVLSEISKYGETYGLKQHMDRSVLILTKNDSLKNFDSLRCALTTDYVISFLTANNFRVYYNEYKTFIKSVSSPKATKLACSESCVLSDTYENLKESAKQCEWKLTDLNKEYYLCLDSEKYLQLNNLLGKYDKSVKSITLSGEKGVQILNSAAYVKHMLEYHVPEVPDYVIYVMFDGQRHTESQAGLLLEMLNKITSAQIYFISQSTIIKNSNISVDDYISAQKEVIERAMTHKYGSDICENKIWASRIENLVDCAIKFEFLRVNMNMPLKVDLSNITDKNAGIFVQYNYARLSNLFRSYQIKVDEGYYKPLPDVEQTDFGLLKLEEEWNLFSYVLTFPKVVQEVLDSFMLQCNLKTHFQTKKIFIMLSDLCRHLSVYYSRIKILGGQQEHLQRIMHARLWLLKSVFQIMNNSFVFLNVQGLNQM